MRFAWVVVLAACGRVGFDARDDGGLVAGDGAHDGAADAAGDALPSDLIAYFPLDGTLVDVVGGPTGTCAAGQCPVAEVAGHLSSGMRFDGADDCVTVADVGQLSPAQITISIWAKADSPLQIRQCQVSKRADKGGMVLNSWQLETTQTASQEAFTSYHGGGGNDQMGSQIGVVQPGVWQHFVGTYDGFTEKIYIDGVSSSTAGNSSPLFYDTHAMQIGCDDNAGFGEQYHGVLDELRIYKRALTQAEIQALP